MNDGNKICILEIILIYYYKKNENTFLKLSKQNRNLKANVTAVNRKKL